MIVSCISGFYMMRIMLCCCFSSICVLSLPTFRYQRWPFQKGLLGKGAPSFAQPSDLNAPPDLSPSSGSKRCILNRPIACLGVRPSSSLERETATLLVFLVGSWWAEAIHIIPLNQIVHFLNPQPYNPNASNPETATPQAFLRLSPVPTARTLMMGSRTTTLY